MDERGSIKLFYEGDTFSVVTWNDNGSVPMLMAQSNSFKCMRWKFLLVAGDWFLVARD